MTKPSEEGVHHFNYPAAGNQIGRPSTVTAKASGPARNTLRALRTRPNQLHSSSPRPEPLPGRPTASVGRSARPSSFPPRLAPPWWAERMAVAPVTLPCFLSCDRERPRARSPAGARRPRTPAAERQAAACDSPAARRGRQIDFPVYLCPASFFLPGRSVQVAVLYEMNNLYRRARAITSLIFSEAEVYNSRRIVRLLAQQIKPNL